MSNKVGVIIQAAGLSSRMGKNKCLLPWKNQTVIETVADAFQHILGPKIAVVGDAYTTMRPLLMSKRFAVVHNKHPEWGQSYSLRLGIMALEAAIKREMAKQERIDVKVDTMAKNKVDTVIGAFCAVGDQPLLPIQVVDEMEQTFLNDFSAQNIILPLYGPKQLPGNPVLFGSAWFEDLKHVYGDMGGREILKNKGRKFIQYVMFTNELYREDIDTPEKYQELIAQWGLL